MPVHNINVSIDLSADEEALLCDVLGCQPDDLDQRLTLYGGAALREYADMFAGQAMGSAADLRERRLVAMLLVLPADQFPSDDQIARTFNVTSSAARALLRTTLSRHRNRLRPVMNAAARAFIDACEQQADESWEVRFSSSAIVQMLNDRLATAEAPRSPIRRVAGTFDSYSVPNGSHQELQQMYPA